MSATTPAVRTTRTGRRVPVYAGCDRLVPARAGATTPARAGTRTRLRAGAPHDGTGGHSTRLQACLRAPARDTSGLPATVRTALPVTVPTALPAATGCARPGPTSPAPQVDARPHTTRHRSLAGAAPCRTAPSPTRKAAS